MLGRQGAAADHDAARHRHHAGRPGPLVLRDHALRHRALARRDRGLRVPEADDGGRVPDREADRGHPELRGPRRSTARARATATAPRSRRPGEKILLHVSNFRPVKRVLDVVRIFERVQPRGAGGAADGRRRAGARVRAGAGAPARASPTACASWDGRTASRRSDRHGRRVPAAVRAGVVRPVRARGDGLRACRWSARTPAACRRWSSTPRPASCCRWATSRAWPRAPSRS